MLFGHTAAITCLAPGSGQLENSYIVSASENGYVNYHVLGKTKWQSLSALRPKSGKVPLHLDEETSDA